MIIVMKPGAPMQECEKIKNGLINNGFQINEIVGVNMTILGVIGDTSTLDINLLRVNDWVEKVMRVQEPFKRANRMFHPEDSVVDVNGIKIGGKKIVVMAGPCSVETEEQIISVAKSVKLGITFKGNISFIICHIKHSYCTAAAVSIFSINNRGAFKNNTFISTVIKRTNI